jgi:hypothetical protein
VTIQRICINEKGRRPCVEARQIAAVWLSLGNGKPAFAVCGIRKNDVLPNDCNSLYEAEVFSLRPAAKILATDYTKLVQSFGEEIKVWPGD